MRRAPELLLIGAACVLLSTSCDGDGSSGSVEDASPSDTDAGELPPSCSSNDACSSLETGACERAICSDGRCVVGHAPGPCSTDPCMTGQTCNEGTCQGGEPAEPDCDGRECGTDGCGNSCGSCGDGSVCEEGACVPEDGELSCDQVDLEGCCTSDGSAVFCQEGELRTSACMEGDEPSTCAWDPEGNDGQGWYDCGARQERSDPSGEHPYLCPGAECTEPCADRECGWACGQECGSCDEGAYCTMDGQCEPCSCDGRECGGDGCGNSCGSCGEGLVCREGTCEEGCGPVTQTGCCTSDGDLRFCNADDLRDTLGCDEGCGWNPEGGPDGEGWYDCGFDGSDPEGSNPRSCTTVREGDGDVETGAEPAPDVAEAEPAPDVAEAEPAPDVAEAEPAPDVAEAEPLDGLADGDDAEVGPSPADASSDAVDGDAAMRAD